MVAEFEALSPTTLVKGNVMLAIINGIMRKDLAYAILAKHGIKEIDPDRWYPEQSWLDAFGEIATELGDAALYAIGRAIPPVIELPPDAKTPKDIIEKLDEIYKAHHRGEAGGYSVSFPDERSAVIVSRNPRPCSYDMGYLSALIEKYNNGKTVTIKHEDEMCCRKMRYPECIYLVNW